MDFLLTSGSWEEKGPRPTMEDAHKCIDNVKADSALYTFAQTYQKCGFWGVYDGHGGGQVAASLSLQLHSTVVGTEEFARGQVPQAIARGFTELDNRIKEEALKHDWQGGSTCVCGLVVDNKLYVANVGDSEAILISVTSDQVSQVILTTKHQGLNLSEKERVESLGGSIFSGRVFGILAVTRAFGDIQFKTPNCNQDYVSCEPYLGEATLRPENKYIVFGCDGLWDFMNYAAVAEMTHKQFQSGATPEQVAKSLVYKALQNHSHDNVTVIVVKIDWSDKSGTTKLPKIEEKPVKTRSIDKGGAIPFKILTPKILKKEEEKTPLKSPTTLKNEEVSPTQKFGKTPVKILTPKPLKKEGTPTKIVSPKPILKEGEKPAVKILNPVKFHPQKTTEKMESEKLLKKEIGNTEILQVKSENTDFPKIEKSVFPHLEIPSTNKSTTYVEPQTQSKFGNFTPESALSPPPGKTKTFNFLPEVDLASSKETPKTKHKNKVPILDLENLVDPVAAITIDSPIQLSPLQIPAYLPPIDSGFPEASEISPFNFPKVTDLEKPKDNFPKDSGKTPVKVIAPKKKTSRKEEGKTVAANPIKVLTPKTFKKEVEKPPVKILSPKLLKKGTPQVEPSTIDSKTGYGNVNPYSKPPEDYPAHDNKQFIPDSKNEEEDRLKWDELEAELLKQKELENRRRQEKQEAERKIREAQQQEANRLRVEQQQQELERKLLQQQEAERKMLEKQQQEAEQKMLEKQQQEAERKILEKQQQEAEQKMLEKHQQETERKMLEKQQQEAEQKMLEKQQQEAERKLRQQQEAERKTLEKQQQEAEQRRWEELKQEAEQKRLEKQQEAEQKRWEELKQQQEAEQERWEELKPEWKKLEKKQTEVGERRWEEPKLETEWVMSEKQEAVQKRWEQLKQDAERKLMEKQQQEAERKRWELKQEAERKLMEKQQQEVEQKRWELKQEAERKMMEKQQQEAEQKRWEELKQEAERKMMEKQQQEAEQKRWEELKQEAERKMMEKQQQEAEQKRWELKQEAERKMMEKQQQEAEQKRWELKQEAERKMMEKQQQEAEQRRWEELKQEAERKRLEKQQQEAEQKRWEEQQFLQAAEQKRWEEQQEMVRKKRMEQQQQQQEAERRRWAEQQMEAQVRKQSEEMVVLERLSEKRPDEPILHGREPQSSIRKAMLGKPLRIPLNIKVDINKIRIKITNDGYYIGDAILEQKNFGEYIIVFDAIYKTGLYKMEVIVEKEIKHVFHVDVEKFQFLYNGPREVTTFVGYDVEFSILCPTGVSTDQFRASFRPVSGDPEIEDRTIIESDYQNHVKLKFRPSKPGRYQTGVVIVGHGLIMESLVVIAQALPSLRLISGTHNTCSVGAQYRWRMSIANTSVDHLRVHVTTPRGEQDTASVIDYKDSTIDILYTPLEAGMYKVEMQLKGLQPLSLPPLNVS